MVAINPYPRPNRFGDEEMERAFDNHKRRVNEGYQEREERNARFDEISRKYNPQIRKLAKRTGVLLLSSFLGTLISGISYLNAVDNQLNYSLSQAQSREEAYDNIKSLDKILFGTLLGCSFLVCASVSYGAHSYAGIRNEREKEEAQVSNS